MTIVAKFWSVGDWEVLYVDGEAVKQNHQGRIDVLDYLEDGMVIDKTISTRVNLPEGERCYPSNIEDVIADDRYDFDQDQL